MRILIVDNNDSFTHNLVHWVVTSSGILPQVICYTDFYPALLRGYDLLIISAGPGHPREYFKYADALLPCMHSLPTLGICLGMQVINFIFGGTVRPLDCCIHGQKDMIVFKGQNYEIARYHSLSVEKVARSFNVVARNQAGIPMIIQHNAKPVLGYQFHPESFLTEKPHRFFDYAYQQLFKNKSSAIFEDTCVY